MSDYDGYAVYVLAGLVILAVLIVVVLAAKRWDD